MTLPGGGDDPNAKSLDSLRGAIFGAVDALSSGSDPDEIAPATEGLPGAEDETPARRKPSAETSDDEEEDGSEGEDDSSEEDSEGESVKKSKDKEKHAAKAGSESPSESEGEAKSEGEDESAKVQERLDAMSYNRRNAVRKFLPGGKANNLANLVDAEAQADNDYWRLQERLSERADKHPAVDDGGKKEQETPVTPPELQHFDSKIQAFQDSSKACDPHIEGWRQSLRETQAKLADLTLRHQRQDPTVGTEEILQLHGQERQIQANINAWIDRKSNLDQSVNEIRLQRAREERTLDIHARLERRESQDAKEAADNRTRIFYQHWNRAFDAVAKDLKIPKEKLDQFRKQARNSTFVHVSNGGMMLEDIPGFLKTEGREFQGLYESAKAEGATSYSEDKRKDSPQAPRGSNSKFRKKSKSSGKSPRPSMRELQRRVFEADLD